MNIAELPIKIDRARIENFCRDHGIQKMSVFGSVLHGDFEPGRSDVDVVVEFKAGEKPGWEFFGWAEDLRHIIGHKVDLHTPDSLSKYFREEVLREGFTIYEQA